MMHGQKNIKLAHSVSRSPHCRGFTITLRHSTLGRTPLDEGPARRKELYLTAHNTHKRQTSIPPARFEPSIPKSKRPQTNSLDRTATGIGNYYIITCIIYSFFSHNISPYILQLTHKCSAPLSRLSFPAVQF